MTEAHPTPPVTPPHGAWHGDRRQPRPSAAHAGVVVVSIALAAALIGGSSAVGDDGLLTLLVLLLGCFSLVVPVAIVGTVWSQARRSVRALLVLAGAACAALVGLAVVRIAAIAPALLTG